MQDDNAFTSQQPQDQDGTTDPSSAPMQDMGASSTPPMPAPSEEPETPSPQNDAYGAPVTPDAEAPVPPAPVDPMAPSNDVVVGGGDDEPAPASSDPFTPTQQQ